MPENGDPLRTRLGALIALTQDDLRSLRDLRSEPRVFESGEHLVREGEAHPATFIVARGWTLRYKLTRDGRRQILKFTLPGDLIGAFASLSRRSAHSVETLTEVEAYAFPPDRLLELFGRSPKLGAALCWQAALDERILEQQILRVGRLAARKRAGHLFVELYRRLRAAGLSGRGRFVFPATQEILADALGMSVVHTNRIVRRMEADGYLRIQRGQLVVEKLARLARDLGLPDELPIRVGPERLPRKTRSRLT